MRTSRDTAALLEQEAARRSELIAGDDASGLVAHSKAAVACRPDDPYAVKDLAEAYVLAREPEKALHLLEPLYRRHPHFETLQWVILDALFAAGSDEADFEWHEVPRVLRLDAATLDFCLHDLEAHGGASEVEGLYFRLLGRAYCAFSVEELHHALAADPRFVATGEPPESEVRLRRARS